MSRKKTLRIILAVTLAVVLAAGATLAYLTAVTPEAVNVFTFSSNISGEIEEPEWDDEIWDPDENGGNGGRRRRTPNTPDEELGENLAKDILPGRVIPKDPALVNTSAIDIYGALKVQFVNGNGGALTAPQLTALMANITIDWNTTAWTLLDGTRTAASHVVYYNDSIASKARTTPYFTNVTINSSITPADLLILQGIPNGFHIKIIGAVIQAEGFANAAAASTELLTVFP